jgi:two-component system, cell cycle sensor histidine kinase and response regulator CckA
VSGHHPHSAIRALVVDDSSSMRRLLQEVLRDRGYDVSVASSGEEAVRLHIHRPFELFLLDWTLPGISGLEVCKELRELEPGEALAIIVVTAKSRPGEVAAAFDAGATDFLSKPIDPSHLDIRLTIAERHVREARQRHEKRNVMRFTENRFEHMVQNLPGVAFQCELDAAGKLRFSYVSSGISELLDVTPEQVARDPDRVFRLLRGEDGKGASLFSRFQGVSTFLTPNDQTHVTLADGTRKWIQVMGRPGRQKDGRIVFDGIMIDVTEHRRAQQALRASEEAFRSLIESSPDSVLVIRSERVAYANPQAVRYLGFEFAAEIIGRTVTELIGGEDGARARERWQRGGQPRSGLPIELRLTRADGRVVVGEATDMPVVYGGQPSVLILIRDLTERKDMQSRLILADRMASVGTLAAGVAHEINNPLSYVMSNLRLTRELLDTALDADAIETMRQQIDEAVHGADRMRHIVFDLKTFSQIEADHQRDEIEIGAVLESSMNMCWNEIRHRARLEKDFGPTPVVTMNESRLGQVFLNLLINAAQAMREDRAETNVLSVRTSTDDEGFAVIEFRDTGEGIAEPNLSRIFDPFFTTKSVAGGTGLGLSICHNILTAAGGEIAAQSEIGRGTTMVVRLPPGKPTKKRSKSGQGFPISLPVGPEANVVVIDDELLVGKSIRRALRGHHVEIFTSGRDAVAHLCTSERVDAVFCDLMMPEMSGVDVFDAVHRRRPEIAARFVFMTGGAFTPRAREFLERSEHRCLEKPFELHEIRGIVRDFAGLGGD